MRQTKLDEFFEKEASHPAEPGEQPFEDVVSHESTLEEIEADSHNKQPRKK